MEQKAPHTELRDSPAPGAALPAMPSWLTPACLISSLAIFLCPLLLQGTGLRLQGQGKGIIIQVGTAMTSKPWFPSQLPQELH